MLHEEVMKYRELSGDLNPNTPISRIGGYLDGYETALEQKPREDAISRLEVLDEINRIGIKAFETYNDYSELFDFVDCLPSVNPQPKVGHWIYSIYGDFHEQGNWLCSHCNYQFNHGNGHAEYCPKCGYEMSEAPTEEVISEYDQR